MIVWRNRRNMEKVNQSLEINKDSPILRAVAEGGTTLVKEIKRFYGFEGSGREFKIHDEDPGKVGKTPDELVELVDEFYERPLDTSHLAYEDVRRGVMGRETNRTTLKALATGVLAYGATLGTTYFLKKMGFGIEAHELPALALGITSPFLGVFAYCLLSPRARAEIRSERQCESTFRGNHILEEEKGVKALASVNYMALRERARRVDNIFN